MSCWICDARMDVMALDPRDMKTKPCSVCENIIMETAGVDVDDVPYTYIDSDLDDFDEELKYDWKEHNDDYDR